MNFKEGLDVADEAVFVKVGRRLSDVEIAILKGSWQRQTYEEIAEATNYSVGYPEATCRSRTLEAAY